MWWKLEEAIGKSATSQVKAFETYAKAVFDENVRRQRRSTRPPILLELRRPEAWALDPGFDPYLVRKRAPSIAHALRARLRDGIWEPRRPAGFLVEKASGGTRTVSTFQIADELISNRLFLSLTRKNHALLSSRAYAYRPGLTPHDAIRHVQTELAREQRVFVAEYDFSKFFDNISHEYLWEVIEDLGVLLTPLERQLIEAFLAAPAPYLSLADKGRASVGNTVGIPQGTSVSLFLANLAATQLDRSLERLGVGFVRYADDTLIWSRSYERTLEAVHALHEASSAIGAPINLEKSYGVRSLVPTGTRHVEMSATTSVNYLGHNIGLRDLRMKTSSIRRIKDNVQALIHANLLREPLAGTQRMSRVVDLDLDYVVLVWQLRRYLYGSLSENQVRRFHRGSIPPMSFEGVMSFFPLINDVDQLQDLDEWMSVQIHLALRKRASLLKTPTKPLPWALKRGDLLSLSTVSRTSGDSIDLRLPSFRRISQVITTAVSSHGLAVVSRSARLYLYDDDETAGPT